MNEHISDDLRHVEIFERLSDAEFLQIRALCQEIHVPAGQVIFHEGDDGDTLFLIERGCVRVSIHTRSPQNTFAQGTINMLYAGQCFGEMVLLGGATRSATITAVDDCTLLVLKVDDFARLCDTDPSIGYRVMHNLASDLAYKLRASNLLLRGNIRWQGDELSRRSSR